MNAQPDRRGAAGRRTAGFTLTELLVTVAIIVMLAGIVLAGLNAARTTAMEARTKATIAKLHSIIMQRYESYMTRRVRIGNFNRAMTPPQVARARLDAVRDLMRMELPDRQSDILNDPIALPARPALSFRYLQLYQANPPSGEFAPAEFLYMIVNIGTAEARGLFNESEVGDVDRDGWPEFIDGWGRPIMFLRWAPGFSSSCQSGDPQTDHDPLDTRGLDPHAYKLVPLIYSGGRDKHTDIDPHTDYVYQGDPYGTHAGTPADLDGSGGANHLDNIHNHHIEAR